MVHVGCNSFERSNADGTTAKKQRTLLSGVGLALLMCALIVAIAPASAQKAWASHGSFNESLIRYDLNYELPWDLTLWYTDKSVEEIAADPHTITDDYAGKRVVFLATGVGKGTYVDPKKPTEATERYLQEFQKAQEYDQFKDINLVILDMDDTPVDFEAKFGPYASDTVKLVSTAGFYVVDGNYYDTEWPASWVTYIYSNLDPDYAIEPDDFEPFPLEGAAWFLKERVERPVAYYMDENCVIRAVTTGEGGVMDSLARAYGIDVSDLYMTLDLDGHYDTDAAYRMLADANANRASGSPVKWDANLEQVAMTRAAEFAVNGDSNLRPSGNAEKSMYPSYLAKAMRSTNYSTMLSAGETPSLPAMFSGETALGAACYVDANDNRTWVVITAEAQSEDTSRAAPPANPSVYMLKENASVSFGTHVSGVLRPGNITTLSVPMGNATVANHEFAWSSSDERVATVKDGVVTAVGAGEVTITASLKEDTSKADSLDLEVWSIGIGSADVTLPAYTYAETGKAITPEPTVTYEGKKLVKGIDYEVSYKDNVKPGEAVVVIEGKGAYSGTASVTFEIEGKDEPEPEPEPEPELIDIWDADISLPSYTYTATGKEIKPEPTVSYEGKKLVKGKDYTVSYENNVSPGEAGVVIEGIGAYTDEIVINFDIVKAEPGPAPAPAAARQVRLAGANAYGTMRAVVGEGFAKSDAVVVATFDGYWDALAASSLAGKLDAPVLLTSTKSLSPECLSEMKRLGAKTAYIVGGTAAVSADVEKQIKGNGISVRRLAGDNALGTAVEIADEVGDAASDTCIIATANGYWDALAASPYAYATKSPIYLTGFDGVLTDEVLEAIDGAGYTRAVIAGGPAAVSDRTEKMLTSRTGVKSVVRKEGKNAYGTASELAKWEISQGMSADRMGIATIGGYWDALTGAALCGRNNAVLVLADDANTSAVSQVMAPNKAAISTYYIFGGEAAVGPGVARACSALWAGDSSMLRAA